VSEKYALMAAESATSEDAPTIAAMCAWLAVSKSGFYEWLSRPASAAAQRREELKIKITTLFDLSGSTYGYRRIHAELVRAGERVGDELVRKLMRELNLVPVQPKPYKRTTIPGEADPAVADLVARDFTAERPGAKLVGDITFIPTWEGWLFLATVIDCFNKEVIGWAMAEHMRTELVTDALDMAAQSCARTGLHYAFRPRHPVYVGRICCQTCRARVGAFAGPDRNLLGQCARGVVFRVSEERAGPPDGVSDSEESEGGYCAVHRIVLQSTQNSFRARLPDTARSPQRVHEFTARSVNGRENRSPENAGQPTPTTCAGCACAASSPVSRTPTATDPPNTACTPRCSSPPSTTDSYPPAWPNSPTSSPRHHCARHPAPTAMPSITLPAQQVWRPNTHNRSQHTKLDSQFRLHRI